jgi:biotin transport system substrate-specific component
MSDTTKLSWAMAPGYAGANVLAQLLWISVFAAATALGARMEIPHQPVPYTLQTLVVIFAGAFLGPRNGSLSQLLYLGAGVLGAPVFSVGGFGIAHLLGPTGGYLLAFPIAAAIVGYLVERREGFLWTLLSMTAGLFVIFLSGTAQLYTVYFRDWDAAFAAGFLTFSWWDLLKLVAAASIYHEFAKRWPRVPGRN